MSKEALRGSKPGLPYLLAADAYIPYLVECICLTGLLALAALVRNLTCYCLQNSWRAATHCVLCYCCSRGPVPGRWAHLLHN